MSDVVTIVNTVVGAIVSIAVSYIGYLTIKTKQQQDKIAAKQEVIEHKQDVIHQENKEANKVAVETANAATTLAVETRDWVNGMKRDVLEEHVRDLKLLVNGFPGNQEYIQKLQVAEARLGDHMRQQGKNDVKDVKIEAAQEQVRVDAEAKGQSDAPNEPSS